MSRTRDVSGARTANTYSTNMNHHILSVLVQNRPGVLARVAGLFARRGYNIFSLAVAPAEEEGRSRITIVVDLDSAPLEQITKQLFKLIDVIKISELDPSRSVERELLIATVKAAGPKLADVSTLAEIFEGKISVVDIKHEKLKKLGSKVSLEVPKDSHIVSARIEVGKFFPINVHFLMYKHTL